MYMYILFLYLLLVTRTFMVFYTFNVRLNNVECDSIGPRMLFS